MYYVYMYQNTAAVRQKIMTTGYLTSMIHYLLLYDTITTPFFSQRAPMPPAEVTMQSTILCCARKRRVSRTPHDTMLDV